MTSGKNNPDSIMGEMDFRMPQMNHLEVGKIIEGTVVAVGSSHVFIDVGSKSEASLDLKEVTSEEGEISLKEGDKIQAYIVAIEPEIELSYALARGHLNLEALEDAHDLGLPVEGKVTGINKGGLEVEFNGARAFCPISQIELGYCEDASVHLEKKLSFRITQFAEEGRNIVVSRRALLEEEQQEAAANTQEMLVEGAEFDGTVITLQPYGAFVDIGGIQGMVHISEISQSHIEHPSEALTVNQTVRVKVTRIENDPKNPKRQRVALSIRALQGDPWEEILPTLSEGTPVTGKIVRLQPFGAFVEIKPGVDGLIHISELSDRRINHPSEVVEVGQNVNATILKVDASARRISLSLRDREEGAAGELSVGAIVEVVVNRIKPFGLLVNIKGQGSNARGLIPAEETGTGRNANLRRAFPEGTELRAMITSVEPESGKIRMSLQACAEQEERADFSQFIDTGAAKTQEKAAPQSLGTFGDLFKQSLTKNKK